MKKSLIALAVLASSGAAMAQSSVTLYGIADIWFGSTKTQISGDAPDAFLTSGSTRNTVLESGGVSGSRWGIKGSEDLGGGLKANFNLEQGFDLSNGAAAGAQFNRQSWVGVSGGFGAVKLGRTGTAYDDILGTNNNTFDSALTARPWVGYTGVASNQIYYALPTMGAISGALSYAMGEDKDAATKAGKIFALNVTYAAGPFMVGFAHQAETAGNTLGLGLTDGIRGLIQDVSGIDDATAALVFTPAAGSKATYNLLTGSYDLGMAKLLASYNTTKLTDGSDDFKAKEFQLGVDVPLSSALTLAVGYGRSNVDVGGDDIYKAKAFSAAANYTLSKRTSVYAGFNNTKTTVAADVTPVGGAEVKSTTYAVGVKHTF